MTRSNMRKKKLIYIAMPYTAETPKGIEQNIENARRFVRENFCRRPQ